MGAVNRTLDNGSPYRKLFDYGSNPTPGQVIYEGWSDPGTPTSNALWRVVQYTWGANGVTDIKFMNGSTKFDQIWDNRASATFV